MLRPNKNYFLVKISKQEQKDRKEKKGRFYVQKDGKDMSLNMQAGEILAIGSKAKEVFPEAEEGHTLLFHHFVEGDKDTKNDVLVFEDEIFNYYVVAAFAHGGKTAEVFGVWNGTTVIPHPEYIFLEVEAPTLGEVEREKFHDEAMKVTSGGLLVFKEYKVTREDNLHRLEKLRNEVMELSKTRMNSEIKYVIEDKEREMKLISQKMNASKFLPYTIAYTNPNLHRWFNKEVKAGDTVFIQEYAPAEIEVNNKTYLVSKSDYIGFLLN